MIINNETIRCTLSDVFATYLHILKEQTETILEKSISTLFMVVPQITPFVSSFFESIATRYRHAHRAHLLLHRNVSILRILRRRCEKDVPGDGFWLGRGASPGRSERKQPLPNGCERYHSLLVWKVALSRNGRHDRESNRTSPFYFTT